MDNLAGILMFSQPILGRDGIEISTKTKPGTIREQRSALPLQQTPAQMCVRSKTWEKLVIKRYSMRTMRAYRSWLELFFAHHADRDPESLGEEEIKAYGV